jgi:cyanophycinase
VLHFLSIDQREMMALFSFFFLATVWLQCSAQSAASVGLIGDAADVSRVTSRGILLMGGGIDVDAAFRWMLNRSGGGDFVILRATGGDTYNRYIYDLGSVNSVETLLISSRTLANDSKVIATIRGAEALFITGGNQANYVNFWKGTQVAEALNYLYNVKGIPIGGTSAGCAILGSTYFSALVGTVTSTDAMNDPYNRFLTLGHRDFLSLPLLSDVITDTHFENPDRRGRMVTFLARMSKDYQVLSRGIGIDEETAVCIESDGTSRVFSSGTGSAFFLAQNSISTPPETCVSGSRLDWYRQRQAVKVYKVTGSPLGTIAFNLSTWTETSGIKHMYYFVNRGLFGVL